MTATRVRSKRCVSRWMLWAAVCLAATGMLKADQPGHRLSVRELAREILAVTGVRGGLIVHLGCGDGRLTAALHADDAYLVQGLAAARGRLYMSTRSGAVQCYAGR